MKIKKIVVGALETNCYILIKDKYALVIDPGDEPLKILEETKNYEIIEVLVTHHHFDHIGGLEQIQKVCKEKKNIFNYQIIETKGHTTDSLSFYFKDINAIFVGDFIFEGTIGRMDLGGSKEEMKKSLEMFLTTFKEDIKIYPGHGKETTLKKEKTTLENILTFI